MASVSLPPFPCERAWESKLRYADAIQENPSLKAQYAVERCRRLHAATEHWRLPAVQRNSEWAARVETGDEACDSRDLWRENVAGRGLEGRDCPYWR